MKKILFFTTVIVCILIINSLARSVYNLWHKQDLVVSVQEDLDKEKKERQKLEAQLSYVKGNEFIEKEARNKLFMVKPGESGVILPSDLIEKKVEKKVPEPSNWQKWLNLFL